jgi:tetratricopeptide (TPR) repeat protein
MHTDKRTQFYTDKRKRLGYVSVCIFFISVCICDFTWAALDIFDHSKKIDRQKRTVRHEKKANFLDYQKDCFLKGDYQQALDSLTKLINSTTDSNARGEISYLIGLSLLKLGRFLEARSYFNDILLMEGLKDDLGFNASLGIGDSYLMEGSLDKAYDVYSGLLTKYPMGDTRCALYYRAASALIKTGRSSEAKRYTDAVKKDFPFSFETRLLDDLVNEANVCEVRSGGSETYSVQVGCYNQKDNVNQICKKLAGDGFDASIVEGQAGENPRYRVKVGKFTARDEAEAFEMKLKNAGYSTKICP